MDRLYVHNMRSLPFKQCVDVVDRYNKLFRYSRFINLFMCKLNIEKLLISKYTNKQTLIYE